jgi:hypothetical protein
MKKIMKALLNRAGNNGWNSRKLYYRKNACFQSQNQSGA